MSPAVPDDRDRVWAGSMPRAYDRWLAPTLFRPFAIDLARRAARFAPRRLLEIAAGTGVLTRELVTAVPAAQVTATDLNAAMIEFGSRQVPLAIWRQADALRLPFDDRTFDLIACQFGVMFFPDRPAAFREMGRVLGPAGRLLFSTWGAVETHGFAAALAAGLAHVFPDDPPAFVVAVPHGYCDLGQVAADVAAGGLECASAVPVTLVGHAASAADVAVGFCTGTPLRAAIEARGDLAAYTARVADQMTARLGPGPVTAKMTAYVIEARPPRGPAAGSADVRIRP
ncbi:MAG TPA: methyltransferase domain-containing protein [Streptosporangiaceae bacterium]